MPSIVTLLKAHSLRLGAFQFLEYATQLTQPKFCYPSNKLLIDWRRFVTLVQAARVAPSRFRYCVTAHYSMLSFLPVYIILSLQIGLDNISLQNASIDGLEFEKSIDEIYQVLGSPIRVDTLIDEIGDGAEFYQLNYDGLILSLKNDVLKDYDLWSDKYQLNLESLKVGDSVKKLKVLFPNSFEEQWEADQDNRAIRMTINSSDHYLLIKFKDREITKISTWTPG